MQILVVDDNKLFREVITDILEEYGHSIVQAESAEIALIITEKLSDPLDLLITEVSLPGISGLQLFEQLHERYPRMKGILMSGDPGRARLAARANSANLAPLEKPFFVEALVECIRILTENPAEGNRDKPA